jgi:hypothetical protein
MRSTQKSKPTWSALYRDKRWATTRQAVRNRDGDRCAACGSPVIWGQGKVNPAGAVVDHIQDHRGDVGLFFDIANLRVTCKRCHDQKSALSGAWLSAESNRIGVPHPEWLPTPACPVTLVTGPAGAGKSTYCQHKAQPGDVVIDLDVCILDSCGIHGHDAGIEHLKQGLWLRNKRLANLEHQRTGMAFFIVSAPTSAEVSWWTMKLGGAANVTHVLLDPGFDAIRARGVSPRRLAVAYQWYQQRSQPWTGKPSRPNTVVHQQRGPIGLDGFPEGWN